MKKNPLILFTGGGSAGHVTPNLALIHSLQQEGWDCAYIGSYDGIEKQLISTLDVPYYGISTGKLRRQLDWRNLLTPFKVLKGIFEAISLCAKLKPKVIFSKGGFVAFPVVLAGWINRIPVIIHESDLTPGLTTRLCTFFAKTICLTFEDSRIYFKPSKKLVVTGTPIRPELFKGKKTQGLNFCRFNTDKPIILLMGGSLGAMKINTALRQALPQLLEIFRIIHLCGKGKSETSYHHYDGYCELEYVTDELPNLFACADIVVSRAGANSLYELLALKKPHILIPLPKKASRGDQIDNANHYAKKGLSKMIEDEKLTEDTLIKAINELWQEKDAMKEKLNKLELPDSCALIMREIRSFL